MRLCVCGGCVWCVCGCGVCVWCGVCVVCVGCVVCVCAVCGVWVLVRVQVQRVHRDVAGVDGEVGVCARQSYTLHHPRAWRR